MAVGITVIKSFLYRGSQEEWSNHYHLTGPDPADSAGWLTLYNALTAAEKTLYASTCTAIAGYGYTDDAKTAHSVWQYDGSGSPIAGTLSTTGGVRCPGDAAVWVRWKLSRNNTKGKAVFLRKYFHDAWMQSTGPETQQDNVLPAQLTALNAFVALLDTGAGIDSGRHIRDTAAASIVSHSAGPYITTRTLKRRGKRPT